MGKKPILSSIFIAFSLLVYMWVNIEFGKFFNSQIYGGFFQIFTLLLSVAWFIFLSKRILSLNEIGVKFSGFLRSLGYGLVYFVIYKMAGIFAFGSQSQLFTQNIDLSIIVILILAAFLEEIVFRGFIFRVWEKKYGFLVGMFISFALFGLVHVIAPPSNNVNSTVISMLTGPLFVLIIGAVLSPTFSLIAYRTENILGIAFVHFLFNFSIFTGFLTPKISLQTMPAWYSTFINLLPIIFPILIDFFDRKMFPSKKPPIKWGKYLAITFSLYFVVIISVSAYLVIKDTQF